MREAREDVEMGGSSPEKRGNPRTPEPKSGPSVSASPDKLQLVQPSTPKRNPTLPRPAGPIRADKPESGPTATINKPTPHFTGVTTRTPKWKPKSPVKVQSNWFLQPALPLKPSTKRTKRPVSEVQSPEEARSQPQKSTSSASKADERVWLSKAKEYVQKAQEKNPVYTEILNLLDATLAGKKYESFETRAERVLTQLENRLQTEPKTKKADTNEVSATKTTYANVAKSATGTETATSPTTGGFKTIEKISKANKNEQARSKPTTKPKPKTNEKQSMQLVLITKKGEKLPAYSPLAIRNAINKAIHDEENTNGPVIGSVSTSTGGNIVLTTVAPYDAETVERALPYWKQVFNGFPIQSCQIQRPWIKLVAHGVPVEAQDSFQEECQEYNPIKVKDAVRWLKKPTKLTGSMVFAVDSQKDQTYCLQKGLLIAGKHVTVVNFRTYSQYSQCLRCQGFGHDPSKCKHRIACKLCGGKHLTKSHTCTICHSSGECLHLEPRCANCKGRHLANSLECDVLRAVRGKQKHTAEPTPLTIDEEL